MARPNCAKLRLYCRASLTVFAALDAGRLDRRALNRIEFLAKKHVGLTERSRHRYAQINISLTISPQVVNSIRIANLVS